MGGGNSLFPILFLKLVCLHCVTASSLIVTDFLIAPVKKKSMSRGGNACVLNVFIVECSSVPYIMV